MSKKYLFLLLFLLINVPTKAQQLLTKQQLDTVKIYTSLQEALQNKDKVYVLNLSNKNLRAVPRSISELSNLQALNLSHNQINDVSVPIQLKKLNNLQYINLSYNKFDDFPIALNLLSNLRSLNLSNNKFKTISPATFTKGNYANLRELNLSRNNLKSLSYNITNLTDLKLLNLKYNNEFDKDNLEQLKHLLPNTYIIFSPLDPYSNALKAIFILTGLSIIFFLPFFLLVVQPRYQKEEKKQTIKQIAEAIYPIPRSFSFLKIPNELIIEHKIFRRKYIIAYFLELIAFSGLMIYLLLINSFYQIRFFSIVGFILIIPASYYTIYNLFKKNIIKITPEIIHTYCPPFLPFIPNREELKYKTRKIKQLYVESRLMQIRGLFPFFKKHKERFVYQVMMRNDENQTLQLINYTNIENAQFVEREIETFLNITDVTVKGECPKNNE